VSAAEIALLAAAGTAAGAVNAVAGAGSLLTFPALLAIGLPPVTANVTNAIAVLPGYLGGSLAYRAELSGQGPRLRTLGAVSAAGAVGGAALLLALPASAFELAAPLLIAVASILLAAQPRLARRRRAHAGPVAAGAATFACAVYGGYFGAGLGLLLLAALGLLVPDDLQRLNALKGALSLVIGAVAAAIFAVYGPVAWDAAAVAAAASFAGGHAGVSVARRLDPDRLRRGIAALGLLVALVLLLW
jgi:uncharacterized protein